MSQQPDILKLQQRLYQQLNNKDSMPTKLSTSIEQQAEALKTAATGKVVLVVLDGKFIYLALWLLSINKLYFYRHVGFPTSQEF